MRLTLALTALAAILSMLAAQAAATPAAKTQVCYQIKNGPYASWKLPAPIASSLGVPREIKGTTWTAFATGVACPSATSARALLAKYPAARKTLSGSIRPPLKGFNLCATSLGSVGCVGKNLRTFTILETGKYTLAQIKQLAATGKLPIK